MGKIRDSIQNLKGRLTGKLISELLESVIIPKDVLKKALDAFLDVIENHVKETGTKLDDVIYGKLIGIIRTVGDIPDNDETEG
jgi:hypothetical protein